MPKHFQKVRVPVIAALVALGSTAGVAAQGTETGEAPPLFASHDLLEFSLYAPWGEVRKDRKDGAEERPAELRLSDGGEAIALQVRTRGNFRLRRSTCPALPPIRLNFPKKDVEGTVFEGQDKLKLVTHCRNKDSDEQNLLQEYLTYRIFNVLTPASFRTRLARITYVDTERPDDEPETKYAFVIEDEDALATRLGGEILEVPQAHPADYDRDGMLLVSIFEYMVGNTDWSLVQFHNIKLFRSTDMVVLPIPYDFDWTGLVNAPYAEPAESVNIDDVRERVYRGYCVEGLDYHGIAALIREKREQILALPAEIPGMTDDARRDARRYLEDFFETLDDPKAYDRRIVRGCRSLN